MFSRTVYAAAIATVCHLCCGAESETWEHDTHPSATITLDNNLWTLRGPNNVHSHIEHEPENSSNFRASASIKAPAAAELSPSVFLYWKPDTWVRIGYISGNDIYHVHGPGVYGIICDNGKETRYRLTTTNSADWSYDPETGNLHPAATDSRWNNLALMLTDSELSFQIAGETDKWETFRSVERTEAFQEAFQKVIIGKGYYADKSHTASDLDNDMTDAGPVTTASIRNVSLEPVLSTEATVTAKEGEHYRDIYGLAELAKPGDPTYDSVAAYWPPLQYTRDALSVASHPNEFVVLPDGQIGMWPAPDTFPAAGKGSKAWFTLGADRTRFGSGTTVSRSLQDNWLPILTCSYRHNGILYKQSLAAWSKSMSPDNQLTAFIRMEVTNVTTSPATTSLGLFGQNEKQDLIKWDDIRLQPSETKVFYCAMNFPTDDSRLRASKIDAAEYEQKTAEVRDTWQKIIDRGMQISIPEQRVMDAWKAWIVHVYAGVDKVNGYYEFHDGAGGFYEMIYGISATRGSQIFDFLNRTEDSRKWIEAMLNMVNKDGLFLVNSGLPDQGALMQSVYHHFRATKDKDWLKKVAPTLLKMSQWSRENRKTAKAQTPTTSPVHGMIKARPYCDHPQPEYYIVSDIYLANGLRYLADTLQQIDMTSESESLRAEADEYSADIQEVLAKSVFEVDGFQLLPLFPETRELLRATGWMGSNYYSLLSTCLLDNGGHTLPPDSDYAKMIVETLEQRGGLLMGLSRFWGGIDHAYTAGYWYHRLINGEPEKALLGLYASMAYGMSRDTYSSVEVTFAKDGKNFPTLPHNYSNQEQLRLVRNLLVTETTDSLYLGAGISRNWLATGQKVGVENAGTPWGNVSYYMTTLDNQSIQMSLSAPATPPPGGIRVFFRHPESRQLSTVEVEGASVLTRDAECITIKPTAPAVNIKAIY